MTIQQKTFATDSMMWRSFLQGMALCFCFGMVVADDHYVSPYGTNNPPYTNWADAATNIQWAIDAASAGDSVKVTNGVYYSAGASRSNAMICITNGIVFTSVNGSAYATINGNWPIQTNRCIYLNNASAVIDGFTITGGTNSDTTSSGGGGGICCQNGLVRNCTIISNYAVYYGAGVRLV